MSEDKGPLPPKATVPTASELGLPWHLKDHDVGYEINATPVGWLFKIYLDDTIGDHPRDDDEPFREAQREHAEFVMRACNNYHDLLAALKAAQEHVGLVRLQTGFDIRSIQEQVATAIRKAEA